MAVDATLWMPSGMDDGEKAEHDAAFPGDPHGAAAAAWESWAAYLAGVEASSETATPTGGVRSVSTGAQSVTFDGPVTAIARAREQAAWHRARSNAESAPVGPEFYAMAEAPYLADGGSEAGAERPNDESNDALWTLGAP